MAEMTGATICQSVVALPADTREGGRLGGEYGDWKRRGPCGSCLRDGNQGTNAARAGGRLQPGGGHPRNPVRAQTGVPPERPRRRRRPRTVMEADVAGFAPARSANCRVAPDLSRRPRSRRSLSRSLVPFPSYALHAPRGRVQNGGGGDASTAGARASCTSLGHGAHRRRWVGSAGSLMPEGGDILQTSPGRRLRILPCTSFRFI